LFPTSDARIKQIAGEHGIVLRGQRNPDEGILGPLTFLHGGRRGQGHVIQFADVIGDEPALKVNLDLAFFRIDLGYLPDITIVDILLVVINRLEDFITSA
jgi:hypothetical protein